MLREGSTMSYKWKNVLQCFAFIVHERRWGIPLKPLLVEDACIQFFLFFPPLSPPAAVRTSHISHWLLLLFLTTLQFKSLQITMFATSTLMFLLFLSLISWLVFLSQVYNFREREYSYNTFDLNGNASRVSQKMMRVWCETVCLK